jgi:Na+-transporting NADH:ubiquinone oxidoreductase subunit NqrB
MTGKLVFVTGLRVENKIGKLVLVTGLSVDILTHPHKESCVAVVVVEVVVVVGKECWE